MTLPLMKCRLRVAVDVRELNRVAVQVVVDDDVVGLDEDAEPGASR